MVVVLDLQLGVVEEEEGQVPVVEEVVVDIRELAVVEVLLILLRVVVEAVVEVSMLHDLGVVEEAAGEVFLILALVVVEAVVGELLILGPAAAAVEVEEFLVLLLIEMYLEVLQIQHPLAVVEAAAVVVQRVLKCLVILMLP